MENNELKRDIFISYKNDGEGRYFAEKLSNTLKDMGFSVYYNTDEHYAGNFPNRLREAVERCTDFLLVLTQACLDQLKNYEKVDWVREEIRIAKENQKNIVPLLMPGVKMPKDKDDMPSELQFLPHENAVAVSDPFDRSPLDCLLGCIKSRPEKEDVYKDVFNSNKKYDVTKDFEDILKRADDGDLDAKYEAAFYYYDGIVGDICYEKAAPFLFELSSCNNEDLQSHADSLLAGLYYSGTVPNESQSYEKALYYRLKATKNQEAQMQAAFMKKIGSGCDFNYEEIEESYKRIKNADSVNKLSLALFYIKYGEFFKAIEVLENIGTNLPEAEYQLGLLYQLGVHTKPPKPDLITAAYHMQNAADQGHILASYEFGMINFNPTGKYRKNFKRAEKYFKIAADSGMSEAQYKLGWIYRFGLSGKKDIDKARYYLEKAAEQGHIGALSLLVHVYQLPGHTNYRKAFEYAKTAADMGDAASAFRTANFYFVGRGCDADTGKACKYYNFAYEHGVYRAKIMLDKLKASEAN